MTYQSEKLKIASTTVGCILSILFAGNVFFIKRLVDKIDSTEQVVWDLKEQVAVLKVTIDGMHTHFMERDAYGEEIPKRDRPKPL